MLYALRWYLGFDSKDLTIFLLICFSDRLTIGSVLCSEVLLGSDVSIIQTKSNSSFF